MFSKRSNKPFVKNGAAVIVASLSLLMGVQIAAYARPMTACENGDWVRNDCLIGYTPDGTPVYDGDCIDRKCRALYPSNNDAAVFCIWCAERAAPTTA